MCLTDTRYLKNYFAISGTIERQRFNAMKKMQSIERHRYENSLYTNEEEDNIVFEDFARLRMNEPE